MTLAEVCTLQVVLLLICVNLLYSAVLSVIDFLKIYTLLFYVLEDLSKVVHRVG